MKDFVNIMGKDNIFIICSIIVVIILALLVIVIIEKASSKKYKLKHQVELPSYKENKIYDDSKDNNDIYKSEVINEEDNVNNTVNDVKPIEQEVVYVANKPTEEDAKKELEEADGTILTVTDARGVELEKVAEDRIEPVAGNTLQISLDHNIQKYCEQAAKKVQEEKQADSVSVLLMNPQDGEIFAMVNTPEFNLNTPFELIDVDENTEQTDEQTQEMLNQMWRNPCINDTYEPGSTFKIITASACLEEGVVSLSDTFSCPGYRIVEDRKIRCHKVGGHGQETFIQGIQNSCNPVFIDIGLRLGAEKFYAYFKQFGLLSLTNIDLPGEAGTIMHNVEDIGLVELATISFGQSFQVTPVQMATTVSSLVNGGYRVTPHFGVAVLEKDGTEIRKLKYKKKNGIVSEKTSETMRILLKSVVEEGSGKNGYIEGYSIGGKTATSQTLPRSANKYISSFIGFAPAEDPQVLGIVVIRNPQGIYYGGTIAAPVLRSIYDNVLPYLGIEKN